MRNSDREFRMAIMPEAEIRSSVAADEAAEEEQSFCASYQLIVLGYLEPVAFCDLKEAVGISGGGRSRPGDTGMASTRSHNVSINPVFSDISQRDVDGIDMFPGRV